MSGADAVRDDDTPFDPMAGARKAASVIVLRDDPEAGLQVLMLRRAERAGDLRSGAAVFPGGVLDARDRQAHAHCRGLDDASMSERLELPQGGLDYVVAALRECFEEVGLLYAATPEGTLPPSALAAAHADWRGRLQRSEVGVAEACTALGLQLDASGWRYWSHWLTPPGNPRRFDTYFFVARAPEGQVAEADGGETTEILWLTPKQALSREVGLILLPVTRRTLEELDRHASVDAVLAHAATLGRIPLTMPRLATDRRGTRRVVLPDEYAWAELGRIDPRGRGDAFCEIVAGRPVQLSPRVIRVTAPNPGAMTGPGTNTYLVGDPAVNRWTVIDPGPDAAAHVQALLAAAPGPIERILVTHTHRDHSPGAVPLAAATGAPVLGRRPAHAQGQDPSFAPQRELADGESLTLGPDATLRVLHTPGHASNHLCFLLQQERVLFTGDHVMQGSTVVINPPDGDMAAYLQALRGLLEIELDGFLPGHGFFVGEPHAVVRALIAHRGRREDKVIAALQALGPGGRAPIEALVPDVYADTPPALHGLAARSLLAHLLKLQGEGRARGEGGGWGWVG